MRPLRSTALFLVALALILGGCSLASDLPPTPTELPAPSPTPSLIPPTSTPEPPVVYLQLTERARFLAAGPLVATLTELADQDGMRFQQGAVDDQIPTQASIIITTGGADIVEKLLGSSPNARIVAMGVADLDPSDNLIVIGPDGLQFERAAFLAGYVGAMLIPDHRTGMLASSQSEAPNWQQAFRNGQRYYCGLCRLAYPPFNDYPIITSLPPDFGQQEFSDALAQLGDQEVRAVYLPPLEANQEYLGWINQQDLIVLSALKPDAEGANLTAIIRPAPEETVKSIWAELQAGASLPAQEMPLVIERLDPDQFSDARLRLAQEVLDELNSGFIQPIGPN